MSELDFWRTCCERGVTVCLIPRPMKEEVACWLVQKFPTFRDRTKWVASHTFNTLDEVMADVKAYFANGKEPRHEQPTQIPPDLSPAVESGCAE